MKIAPVILLLKPSIEESFQNARLSRLAFADESPGVGRHVAVETQISVDSLQPAAHVKFFVNFP
jgi:hypothetical protein